MQLSRIRDDTFADSVVWQMKSGEIAFLAEIIMKALLMFWTLDGMFMMIGAELFLRGKKLRFEY